MKLFIIVISEVYSGQAIDHKPIVCLSHKEANREMERLFNENKEDFLKKAKSPLDLPISYNQSDEFIFCEPHNYAQHHFTATINKVEVAGIVRKENNNVKFKEFWMLPEEERKGITDSLLLESGIEVASGRTKDFSFSVVTQGHVRLVWKDEVYKYRGDFPDDLVEAIRNHTAENNPDYCVDENNWYELIIWDEKNGKDLLYSDLFDIDLSTITEDELKELVMEEYNNRNWNI